MKLPFTISARPHADGQNIEVQVYIPRTNGQDSFILRGVADPSTIRRLAEELLEVCKLLEQA